MVGVLQNPRKGAGRGCRRARSSPAIALSVKTALLTDAELRITSRPPYASRGGEKLEHALHIFNLERVGLIAGDFGASTGGFTDCLLQHGAARVYAVDVGYGQLDYRLRQDPRVVVLERTNARNLETLPEALDVATVDVSFISLTKVLEPVARLSGPAAGSSHHRRSASRWRGEGQAWFASRTRRIWRIWLGRRPRN